MIKRQTCHMFALIIHGLKNSKNKKPVRQQLDIYCKNGEDLWGRHVCSFQLKKDFLENFGGWLATVSTPLNPPLGCVDSYKILFEASSPAYSATVTTISRPGLNLDFVRNLLFPLLKNSNYVIDEWGHHLRSG